MIEYFKDKMTYIQELLVAMEFGYKQHEKGNNIEQARAELTETMNIDKPNTYKCGHKGDVVIMDDNCLSIAEYLTWRETTGPEGDNSECFDCHCKKITEREK